MAAKLTLQGFRNDPFHATLRIGGIDLTGAAMALAVRLYPNQPGDALIEIEATDLAGAEGIRLVSVGLDDDGVPESWIEIIIAKPTIQGLPALTAGAEIGDPATFHYDLQATPAEDVSSPWTENIEQTLLFGPFIINGSANS